MLVQLEASKFVNFNVDNCEQPLNMLSNVWTFGKESKIFEKSKDSRLLHL